MSLRRVFSLLLWLLLASQVVAAFDPTEVLILVNDLAPPEAGTGATGASVYVGEYYATRRGIPFTRILHLSIPLSCCSNDPHAYDSRVINLASLNNTIRTPLRNFLAANGLTSKIKYIVPTYGVPVQVTLPNANPANAEEAYSIDSFLAALNAGTDQPYLTNPYAAGEPKSLKVRFSNWANPFGWPMYLVTRLDGPSAMIAAGLVDKAIQAESGLRKTDGNAYFDYWHNFTYADSTVLNAYNLAVAKGFPSFFNDQSVSGTMIARVPGPAFPGIAPNTLWAWGWYSGPLDWPGYSFVNGAVGAQLTSYTGNNIRATALGGGHWVARWLSDGITATWGATGEPYTTGYANGDNLLQHFWTGYNFAESAYLAAPALNWMMVFVGDPLYQPRIFTTAFRASVYPRVDVVSSPNPAGGYTYYGDIDYSLSLPVNDAQVQFQLNGIDVGTALTAPPYTLRLTSDPGDFCPCYIGARIRYSAGRIVYADPTAFVVVDPRPIP